MPHVCQLDILMPDDKRGESPRKQVRLPAIAPKDDQSSTSSTRSVRMPGPAIPPRARLPPRSRTGCWTCRQRKVKCDEGRPVCGQCSRLGHTCDYSPRLSFRDDTLRVVERMQDVTTTGSIVWDSRSPLPWQRRRRRPSADASIAVASPTPSSAGSVMADDLPPFSALTTDEERERKAEASSPGTYNVVVNPESFQHLPEYNDDVEIKRERLSPLRRGSIATSLASSLGRDSLAENGVPVPGDPNTVILPRFEDLSRRATRDVKSPTGPASLHQRGEEGLAIRVKIEQDEGGDDSRLFDHFRSVVWRQLVPTEEVTNSSFTSIERIAQDFQPLYHAILAVACQSHWQRGHRENFDALQHYTYAIEFLKREEDLASDGVFLTHFLMLIYEIATANIEHSLIRTHHLDMLMQITQLRRQTLTKEQFPYIIWWICHIDLDTLFSGTGSGQFVTFMLEHETVPPPSFHLYPLGADGSSIVYGEERESLPVILQLDYDITLLAFQLALLSHEFRQDATFGHTSPRDRDMAVRLRQSRMYEIQESLRRRWMAPTALAVGQSALPSRPRRVWEHAYILYRTCLIYSHTSMWPAQRLDTSAEAEGEIGSAIADIFQLAQSLVFHGHLECRFLVLAVFIAGFASTDGRQKMIALDLLSRMEQESIGRNTSLTRRGLEVVYEQQNEQFMITGHSLDVDWMQAIRGHGISIVNFGM